MSSDEAKFMELLLSEDDDVLGPFFEKIFTTVVEDGLLDDVAEEDRRSEDYDEVLSPGRRYSSEDSDGLDGLRDLDTPETRAAFAALLHHLDLGRDAAREDGGKCGAVASAWVQATNSADIML